MSQTQSHRFSYDYLKEWGRKVLSTTPMSAEEIDAVMTVLLDTNLRGVDTHGINMLPSYAERFKAIEHRQISVVEDKGTGCVIDGGNHTGQMTSLFALEKAKEKADRYGLGLALLALSVIFILSSSYNPFIYFRF